MLLALQFADQQLDTFCNWSTGSPFWSARRLRASRFCSWSSRWTPHSGLFDGGF